MATWVPSPEALCAALPWAIIVSRILILSRLNVLEFLHIVYATSILIILECVSDLCKLCKSLMIA
jgi:hypothetical protein